MKGFILLLAVAALVGCVQQPVQQYTSPVPQSQSSAEAQNRARIHTELGEAYYTRAQYAVALEELAEALRSDSSYGPAYNALGLVYMELGETQKAEQNFKRAIDINHYDSNAHHNYGWFLCQSKREEEAITHFMIALKNPLYTTPEKSYLNAGICARNRGDTQGAEEYLDQALRLRPGFASALLNMADLQYSQGRYTQAKAYLTRYMQVAQPDAESLWLGVRLERKLGERDAEASYSLQLRKRFPESKQAQSLMSGHYD